MGDGLLLNPLRVYFMSRSFLIRDLLWGPEGRDEDAKEVGLDLTTRAADPQEDEGCEFEASRTLGADEGRRQGDECAVRTPRTDDDVFLPSASGDVGVAEGPDGRMNPPGLPSGHRHRFLVFPRAAYPDDVSPSRSPRDAAAADRSPAAASASPPPSPPFLQASPRPQGIPALAHHAFPRSLPGKGLGCGFGDVRRFLPVPGGGARPVYGPVPLMGAVPHAPAPHHHHSHYLWAAQYSSLLSALPLQGMGGAERCVWEWID